MQNPLPKGFTRQDVPAIVLVLITLVMTSLLFGFFMVPYSLQVNFDEGCEAAAVERVISGRWLPYVDASAIRGPFLYWTQAVVHVLTGRFEYTGTRVLALLCALVVVVTTFLTGWGAGWPLAGAIGGAAYLFVIGTVYLPGGGMGVVGESVAIAYLTTAFCLVAYGLYRARSERARITFLALGGFFVGIAGLTKQTMAGACVPLFLWIFARSIGERLESASSGSVRYAPWTTIVMRRLLPFGAGGLALVALVLLRYAAAGEFKTFVFWSTTFGAKVYMQPFEGRVTELMSQWFFGEPWAIFGVALALTVALGRPFAAIKAPSLAAVRLGLPDSAFELTVGLMAVTSLASAALPLRIWPHYFMPVYPFFGLVVGTLVERLLRRGGGVPWFAQSAAVVVLGGSLIASATTRLHSLRQERARGSWGNPRPDPVCTEIDRIAGPGRDPIFVWGTAGDLYITCQRPSVTMFTSTMIIAGIVPPSWTPEPSRVAPGIHDILLRELSTHPPPVLLDHPMSPGASMMDFGFLSNFVKQRYCRLGKVTDKRGVLLTFYARKDLQACQTAKAEN